MLVKPVEGRLVLDPRTNRQVPEAGIQVPDLDFFWARRIAQGDVTVSETEEPATPATPAKAPPPMMITGGEGRQAKATEEQVS